MDSEDEGETPITAREGSPIDAEEKRAMVRELDRAIRYGSPGVTTSTWATFPGCAVTFAVAEDDRVEIRLTYEADDLPGPVTVSDPDADVGGLVSRGDAPTAFVGLSAAHHALYEDLTDAAGRAVDPYAVTVPDTPFARSATDGTVTFLATLSVLTGERSPDRRTFEWG